MSQTSRRCLIVLFNEGMKLEFDNAFYIKSCALSEMSEISTSQLHQFSLFFAENSMNRCIQLIYPFNMQSKARNIQNWLQNTEKSKFIFLTPKRFFSSLSALLNLTFHCSINSTRQILSLTIQATASESLIRIIISRCKCSKFTFYNEVNYLVLLFDVCNNLILLYYYDYYQYNMHESRAMGRRPYSINSTLLNNSIMW